MSTPPRVFNSVDEVRAAQEAASTPQRKRIFVAYGADVVDATDFVDLHPGGRDLIADFDGGRDMKAGYDGVGHSKEADKLLTDMRIGTLRVAGAAAAAAAQAPSAPVASSSSSTTLLVVGGIVAAAAVAVIALFLRRRA
jgi:cytochrome b involved in lipid metabolism